MALKFKAGLIVFALLTLGWTSSCLGQTPQPTPVPGPEPRGTTSASEPLPDQPGTISGTIVDQSGAVIVGARVRLTGDAPSRNQEVLTGDDGQFSFANIA